MLLGISVGLKTFLVVLGVAGGIAIVAFLLYLSIRPKLKLNDKPTEEEVVQEEMNRLLKPIEDDDTAKAVNEYKDEEE